MKENELRYFEAELARVEGKLERHSSIWCLSADINNLKKTNDALGHAAGDALIRAAAELLRDGAEGEGRVYRVGGDEFVLLLFDRSEADVRALRARLDAGAARYSAAHSPGLSIAFGCDRFRFSDGDTLERLLSRADQLMYEDKRNWKEAQGPAQ